MRDVLRTALCDLLGIEYPVIQSSMGSIAGPDLVAEVSRAGGLGILAGLPGAGEMVETIVHEAHAVRAGLPHRVQLSQRCAGLGARMSGGRWPARAVRESRG